MYTPAALALLPALVVHVTTVAAQPPDTARIRQAYNAVAAHRDALEKAHGRFATVNGIKLHYLEWGTSHGVPLIWAPGSASTAWEIRGVARRLADAGYRVIAVDYRGHGLTRVADFDFTIHDVADDLVALLDHLKIPAAVFGGASKGGFVAAAVYDHYPSRVLGLLMADGGTWSNQWVFDHHGTEMVRQQLAANEGPPKVQGASEFEVFARLVGRQLPATGEIPADRLLDVVTRIGPGAAGQWEFLPGFDQMMGSLQRYYEGATKPSTMPLLQWSQHALIPMAVFRRLHVPMVILDPQHQNDDLPVTDQNERLARKHPALIVHRVYEQTPHNVVGARPDWFVRDAVELLGRVRGRAGAKR